MLPPPSESKVGMNIFVNCFFKSTLLIDSYLLLALS